jgi:hypothetical protein
LAVPYNGYGNKRSIQKVKYKGQEWYRTIVAKFDGPTNTNMLLPTLLGNQNIVNPSKFPFTELKENSVYYYRLDFDIDTLTKSYRGVGSVADYLVYSSNTDFLNPLNGRSKTVDTETNNLDNTLDSEKISKWSCRCGRISTYVRWSNIS